LTHLLKELTIKELEEQVELTPTDVFQTVSPPGGWGDVNALQFVSFSPAVPDGFLLLVR